MDKSNSVSISILVATRNRAASLTRTLDSLFISSNISKSDWEVIVADNGSIDRTSSVCRMFRERYSDHFKFVFENRGGKSCALNKGIQMCQGQVLVLIDDDVICQNNYLNEIRSSLAECKGRVVQGRVYVDYDGELPSWFDDYFESMMCRIDLGDKLCDLQPPRQLWGLNAVLPMEAMTRVGGFCPELGPGASGFSDDVELSRRLRGAEYRLIYDPAIVVRHQISTNRLTVTYVLARSYSMGRSTAYYEQPPAVPLWRYTAYIAKEILRSIPRLLLNMVSGKWSLAVRTACTHAFFVGFISQLWKFQTDGGPSLTPPVISIPRLSGGKVNSVHPSRS